MYIFIRTTNNGLTRISKSEDKNKIARLRVEELITAISMHPIFTGSNPEIDHPIEINLDDFLSTIETDKDFDNNTDMIVETGNIENFENWLTTETAFYRYNLDNTDIIRVETGDVPPRILEFAITEV